MIDAVRIEHAPVDPSVWNESTGDVSMKLDELASRAKALETFRVEYTLFALATEYVF